MSEPTEQNAADLLAGWPPRLLGPLALICFMGWGLALGLIWWQPSSPQVVRAGPPATPLDASQAVPNATYSPIAGAKGDGPLADGTVPDLTSPPQPNADSESMRMFSSTDEAVRSMVPRSRMTLRELQLADVMLAHGDVARAIDVYRNMRPPAGDSQLHDQLAYRVCVAQELLNRDELALAAYAKLVQRTSSPIIEAACQLGQARIWMRHDKAEAARSLLAHVWDNVAASSLAIKPTEEDEGSPPGSAIRDETAHLLGLCFAHFDHANSDQLLVDKAIQLVYPYRQPTRLIELADPSQKIVNAHQVFQEGNALGVPEIEVTYRYGEHPSEVRLSATIPLGSIQSVVEQLLHAAGLKVVWTPGASDTLRRRTTYLQTQPNTLALILDRLLSKYGLMWTAKDGEVIVATTTELSDRERRALERQTGSRLLRFAVSQAGEHPLAMYSHLALANAMFAERSFEEAVSVYQKCREQYADHVDVVVAEFNRAKTLLRLNRRDEAIKVFFRVADGSHGHPMQSAANSYAGRMLLENGRSTEAARPLMRAFSTGQSPFSRAYPTLALAAVYLFSDNAHAAARVLMESREDLNHREDTRELAAFLNSYAQFTVAQSELDRTRAGHSLISSLGRLPTGDGFGDYWPILIGRALRDVGLSTQMAIHYQQELNRSDLPAWITGLLKSELIDYWRETRNHDQLEKWLVDSNDEDAPLELARVQFARGDFAGCVGACFELIKDDPTPEKLDSILKLAGRAFQAQGNHYDAALCFAGMVPGEEADRPEQLLGN